MLNPVSSNEINSAWLSACLGFQVDDFDLQRLPSGYMSDVFLVGVNESASSPFSFVLKLAASASDRRRDAHAFNSYRKEVQFYQQLQPVAAAAGLQTPACYFSRIDTAGNPAIGLEDLSELDPVPESRGCDLPQALAVTAALARLNAEVSTRVAAVETIEIPGFQTGFGPAAEYLASTSLHPFGGKGMSINLLQNYMTEAVAFLPTFLAQIQVISHMDCRLDNLRFRGSEPVLFDWGEVSFAPIGFDLANFMVTSLSAENYRDWEVILLDAYLARVQAAGMRHISQEALHRGYRLSLLPLVYLPLLIRDRGDTDFAHLLFRRLTAALERHGEALTIEMNNIRR